MKSLLLIALTTLSLNVFANQLGEDLKSECSLTSQTSKREAKVVPTTTAEEDKKKGADISK